MIDTHAKDGAYGIRDLYLVFKSGTGQRDPLFRLSQFEFSDETVPSRR